MTETLTRNTFNESSSKPLARLAPAEWAERIGLAVLFVGLGALIIIVFSPLRPLLGKTPDYLGRIGLVAVLIAAVIWARRSQHYEKFASVLLGLLILAVAVSMDRFFSIYLAVYLNVSDKIASGWAILKLNEAFIVIATVVVLTRLSGGSLGSIYIQKGKLKQGLLIGLITFCLCAAGATGMAYFLFKGQDLTPARIWGWLPWLLIFVLANAAQEEILFRGLFLRKLQPFFGNFISVCLIALVFSALHLGTGYMSSQIFFTVGLVLLALVWGTIMQKTDSVWGSILFHAGTDIPIMLGIFSTL